MEEKDIELEEEETPCTLCKKVDCVCDEAYEDYQDYLREDD